MSNTLSTLYQRKEQARACYEALAIEERALREQLTQAQRRTRAARQAHEAAMLAWVNAYESATGTTQETAHV